MPLESFYPMLLTADVRASTRFYTEHMGFEKVFESDWYVSLKHLGTPPTSWRSSHTTTRRYRKATDGQPPRCFSTSRCPA